MTTATLPCRCSWHRKYFPARPVPWWDQNGKPISPPADQSQVSDGLCKECLPLFMAEDDYAAMPAPAMTTTTNKPEFTTPAVEARAIWSRDWVALTVVGCATLAVMLPPGLPSQMFLGGIAISLAVLARKIEAHYQGGAK